MTELIVLMEISKNQKEKAISDLRTSLDGLPKKLMSLISVKQV